MRRPGIEPGPPAWKAGILTTELSTLYGLATAAALTTPRALGFRPGGLSAPKHSAKAFDGIRTRDLSLTKRVLCQLSYEGTKKWRIRVSIPVPRRC